MKLSRDNIKSILFIALCIILMCSFIWRIDAVFDFLSYALYVINPIIIGFCIAFILNITVSFFETTLFGFLLKPNKKGKKHAKFARGISIILTIVVFVGAIALLLYFIIPQVVNTISTIIARIPAFAELSKTYLDKFGITSDKLSEFLLNGQNLMTTIGNFIKNNVNSFLDSAKVISTSLVSGVLNTFLGIFVAFYFLFSKEKIMAQIKRLSKAVLKPVIFDRVTHIIQLSATSFENFISGQFLEAIILACLTFVGMLILGIPYSPVVAVIIGVTALIPIIGAWIGAALSAFLILIVNPIKALWFLIFIVILQQIEGNLIYPKVVGKQVGLPGVWVLLAIVVGTGVFGAFGALLAVPVASVVYVLLGEFVSHKEKKKNEGSVANSEE